MEEDLQKQAITLILPCLVSSINLFVPLFFSFLGLMERFKYPWHEIYVLIIRYFYFNSNLGNKHKTIEVLVKCCKCFKAIKFVH